MSAAPTLAVDLDAIGDTRPLWEAWLDSARTVLEVDPRELPTDRAAAAAALDGAGAGNWRTLLERFSEDHAPAYLRRDAATSAALRSLAGDGATLGVFTDAPEPLARVALAQLGASRRVSAVETGAGALARLLASLGPHAVVVRTRDDLLGRP
jgi:phosphoglycolate phosphatase-like HAD superfamily hydrolase